MTDDAKPINGADVRQAKPHPDVAKANEQVTAMMRAIKQAVARTRTGNVPDIIADQVLHSMQIQTVLSMLFEGELPILDWMDYNRRLGEACARQAEQIGKPQIAIAVADAIRPKR